jgi:hypothetical protein
MSSVFTPSQILIDTLKEQESDGIGDRIDRLVKDFYDTVDCLPGHKTQIANMPDGPRQMQVDRLFSFFAYGAATAIDKRSNFNTAFDKTVLENRRDLN